MVFTMDSKDLNRVIKEDKNREYFANPNYSIPKSLKNHKKSQLNKKALDLPDNPRAFYTNSQLLLGSHYPIVV